MKKEAFFFTTADPDIGLGHLFRCDALAFAMRQAGVQTTLIVESSSTDDWLEEIPLYTNYIRAKWKKNPEYIGNFCNSDALKIFDAYDVDPKVWDQQKNHDVIVFDDCGEKPFLPGYLINGGPGAFDVGYSESSERTLLLGPHFQVLRPPFWKKTTRVVRERVQAIGIILGGTDHRGIMENIISLIRNNIADDITIYAIGIKNFTREIENIYNVGFLTAKELKNLFTNLDFVLTAAGQTVAEAVSAFLPAIILETVENQSWNYRSWYLKYSAVLQGGKISGQIPAGELLSAVQKMMLYQTRKVIVKTCEKLDMCQSTNNIVECLLNRKYI